MVGISFDVDNKDITILLSSKTDLNLGDTVVIHCEKGLNGSVSSSTLPGVYSSLALECRSKFDLDLKGNIEATLVSKEVNVRPEAKAYSQGVSEALEFTNQGGDIIAQKAMKEVVDIVRWKLETFGAVILWKKQM
jgi:hypothetical protein